ncbi:tetratricopeptide repeat protein [Aequorivita sp. Q41]|uniref:tetratricopeptide repeat protein n=1 Tax=Aequorivita sp. Q41 TaxID=3153300 RepID=UPI003242FC4A
MLFILETTSSFSQEEVSVLVDSLAKVASPADKTILSLKVASGLADIDWERTRYYIDIAKENAIAVNSPNVLANYYQTVGGIYSEKDALDIALENFFKAYEFYELITSSEKFKLDNNLAIVYARTGNQESALKFFRKAYSYQQIYKDSLHLASILNNMGRIWLEKDVDSSLLYFKKSLKLAENIENPNLKVYLYTNIGKCYLLKEDFKLSKEYYNLAITSVVPKTNLQNKAWVYDEFSEYYLKIGNADSAIFYSKKSVNILDSVAPYSFEHQRAVKLLYKSYLTNNDFEAASRYFEKYTVISDTLNLEDKRVNVEKLLIGEEYRNKEKIRELEESKQHSRNYIILLVLLAILLFLGILLVKFRNKLKRAKLEKQLVTAKQLELNANLQLKNKELIGKAMIEMHRTEIIEDILNDLKKIKLKAVKKETQNAIDYIVKRLKRDTSSNVWEEFELRFEQVHESFYKHLSEKHPGITSRDKRLCALLKLNLTSKEIAQITGQSLKSVENARTRLRKKLNITNSHTDLSVYLSTFG